jgi:hypothetical protein
MKTEQGVTNGPQRYVVLKAMSKGEETMRFARLAVLLMVGLFSLPAFAQERLTEHTLKLSDGKKSPTATIEDMAWLAGHWTGQALGGDSEEIWTSPKHGVMMGMYRLIRSGKPIFYELLTIVEENSSLIIRLKHFNPDLTGWEEKNKTIDFPFVGKTGGVVHFNGMAFHPNGESTMTVFLAIRQKDGTISEEAFRYTRVSPRRE